MEQFEKYDFGWQEAAAPRQKKPSPYADSPYLTHPQVSTQPPLYAPPQPKAKKPKKEGRGGKVLSVILTVVFVLTCCCATAWLVSSYYQEQMALLNQVVDNKLAAFGEQIGANTINPAPVPETGLTPSQIYAKNAQSVVAISNQGTTMNFYGQVSQTASFGSGFILTQDGYVVTNYHVAEGAASLRVITYDSQEHEATLVGCDATNDVALLKIEATGLPCVTVGSSDDLIVGDQVAAIGNPLGELTSTLTVGYVSAKDRMVTTEGVTINMLQTDAAINSGNSGGPLFNTKGEVVGITTAKYTGTTESGATIEGIGFAIPIDDVIGILQDLQQFGYVTGAYLGVSVRNMDAATADMYSLPLGAYVDSVLPGLSADRAGIRAKDIILNLGGYEISTLTDLTRALRWFKAGDTTTVTVYRAGAEVHMSITLDEKPVEQIPTEPAQPTPSTNTPNDYSDWWFNQFPPYFGG